MGGILSRQKSWKLRDLVKAMQTAYCGNVGVEYMHIQDPMQQLYIRDAFELR
jgi:2-oxoglutarate dehydrogenase complex dehydrogenase (E1) component-like enzyme